MSNYRRSVRARNNKKVKEIINLKNFVLTMLVIICVCVVMFIYKGHKRKLEIAEYEKQLQEQIQQIFAEEKQEEKEEEEVLKDTVIKITTVGDILCETEIYEDAYNKENNTYDFSHIFNDVKQYTLNSDLTIGLLETNFVKEKEYSGRGKYNAPIEFAKALKNIGIDVLNTANNHSLDYGYEGVKSTLDVLKENEIDTVGMNYKDENNSVLIKDVKGIKLAFLSYTYGTNNKIEDMSCVNFIDKEKIKNDILKAKESNAEYVFVHMHWGDVNSDKPNEEQKELANYLFENGADFILGSHPASLQLMEVKENTDKENIFIAYSTGNFISSSEYKNSNIEMILDIEITKDAKTNKTKLTKVTYTPVYLKDNGKSSENRYELLDMGKVLRDYNADEKLYNTIKQARTKIDELIGKE